MRNFFVILVFALWTLVPITSYGQTNEVALLQKRIAQLEMQNQKIMEKLAELSDQIKGRYQQTATTESAVVVPTVMPDAVFTETNHSRLSFYGFARLDAIFDDSRPSAAQTPTFIPSETPGAANDGNFALHTRLTRMGINYKGQEIDMLGGISISARIETDFQNGGSESRARLRYRHAYAKLDWGHSSLLLGQTWDIISPLYPTVNADTMMWNAGNLGDRRVQAKYTYTLNSNFSVAVGITLTGAINMQDLDGNGVRDGEDSGVPQFQGRAAYKSEMFDLGIWGHYANEETAAAFNGNTDFDSHSVGVDFVIRPMDRVSLKGELWTGSGLGDVRGGIGQSINTITGQEIDSHGGWIELGFKPTSTYSITAGWTIDNPDNGDLAAGSRKLNRVWYVTNQLRLHPSFLVGVDYLHWKTNYIGLPQGTDNRLNFYSVYYF